MKNKLTRLLTLLTALLILGLIALRKDERLWGHDFSLKSTTAKDTAASTTLTPTGIMIVNTRTLGVKVKGYAGDVPLMLHLHEGRIDSIAVQDNQETPDFLEAATSEILPPYQGKTIEEALRLQPDAVSGATLSSRAILAHLNAGLHEAQVQYKATATSDATAAAAGSTAHAPWREAKFWAALLVSLLSAILPLVWRNKTYRTVQLVLNVLVLGFYTGTFVSFTSMVGLLSNGIDLWSYAALAVLLIVAFLYPLFGKRQHYCNWSCPLGSAQELIGKAHKRKWRIPQTWFKPLERFRLTLWAVLILLAWSGILLEWMNYEPFTAFLWQSASWVVLVFTLLTLVLSLFVQRPYCRFICPTGTLLKRL